MPVTIITKFIGLSAYHELENYLNLPVLDNLMMSCKGACTVKVTPKKFCKLGSISYVPVWYKIHGKVFRKFMEVLDLLFCI